MKKRSPFKRATAAALLTAALTAPAVLGLTAGTASARPMSEAQCVAMENSMFLTSNAMNDAQRAGNTSEYRYWASVYDSVQAAYSRGC